MFDSGDPNPFIIVKRRCQLSILDAESVVGDGYRRVEIDTSKHDSGINWRRAKRQEYLLAGVQANARRPYRIF